MRIALAILIGLGTAASTLIVLAFLHVEVAGCLLAAILVGGTGALRVATDE